MVNTQEWYSWITWRIYFWCFEEPQHCDTDFHTGWTSLHSHQHYIIQPLSSESPVSSSAGCRGSSLLPTTTTTAAESFYTWKPWTLALRPTSNFYLFVNQQIFEDGLTRLALWLCIFGCLFLCSSFLFSSKTIKTYRALRGVKRTFLRGRFLSFPVEEPGISQRVESPSILRLLRDSEKFSSVTRELALTIHPLYCLNCASPRLLVDFLRC